MLRVLSKALARHLQKYPDQGYAPCPTVPDYVNKLGKVQCQRRESTHSPSRNSPDIIESLTPQLDKHLHVKNTYVPELVAGMKSVAKKRCQDDGELRRPVKAEQYSVKSPSKKKFERNGGTTPFPSSKCPAQVERIKQSLSKREEMRKKFKRNETKSRPKTKEAKEVCEETESKTKPRNKDEPKKGQDDEKQEPPKPAEPKKTEKVEKNELDYCFEKIMYGWANLAKEMNGKSKKEVHVQTHEEVPCQTDDSPPLKTKIEPSPKEPKPKNDQLCYSCVEELWEGGHRGDCRSSLPADSLQRMVKDQSDRLAGKLDLLGQKIEKDIKDMLLSWEVSSRKAKKAMEDAENFQAERQNVKSTSIPFLGDYARKEQSKSEEPSPDISCNKNDVEPDKDSLSETQSSVRSSCRKDAQETEQPWFKDAHGRLVSMLRRVRTAVNKTRALPSTMSQHSNSTMSRPYSSTSSDSLAQKKEIEELYGLISAKGELIAKDIQNRIRKALKELKA